MRKTYRVIEVAYDDFIKKLREMPCSLDLNDAKPNERILHLSYSRFLNLFERSKTPFAELFGESETSEMKLDFLKSFPEDVIFFDSFSRDEIIKYCAEQHAIIEILKHCDYHREFTFGYNVVIFNRHNFSEASFDRFYLHTEKQFRIYTGIEPGLLRSFFTPLIEFQAHIEREDIFNFLGTYFDDFEPEQPFTKRFDLSDISEVSKGKQVSCFYIFSLIQFVKKHSPKEVRNHDYAVLLERAFAGFEHKDKINKSYEQHIASIIKKIKNYNLKLPFKLPS